MILPMLIEALPLITGAVAGVTACAFIYLKQKQNSAESTEQPNKPTPADASTTTAVNQDTPESVISTAAEAIASEVTQAAKEPVKTEPAPVVVQKITESVAEISPATVAEEPMLNRHHLHNIRVMLEATTFPRPTDSMLKRHYDEMIDAKADDCLNCEVKMACLIADYEALQTPENDAAIAEEIIEAEQEAMLKRHHLHHIRVMLEATTFPRPADSALSRHYDEMIDAKAEDCLTCEAKMARLLAEYEAYEKAQSAEAVKEAVVVKTAVSEAKPHMVVPQDSTLRRHFLTQLRIAIENNKAPRPTDSALRRHYDSMINAELENYLACH